MNYVGFVVKGIESICAMELTDLVGVKILEQKQKFIQFEYDGDPEKLRLLKTIDDIGILISENELGDSDVLSLIDNEKVRNAIAFIGGFRMINSNFSVTVSIYENENYKKDELIEKIASKIHENLKLEYVPLDHSNIDIRLNMEGSHFFVTVKLFSESLYKRSYGHETLLGSLRPTIAAAMLYKLLDGKRGLKIVDNFCGSGTFLCEAVSAGCDVYGGDTNSKAVEMTNRNLAKLFGNGSQIIVQDAAKTKWPDNFFDVAVSNFPWDKQVEVHRFSELFDGAIKEYSRILKSGGKIGFISTKPEMVMKFMKKYFEITEINEYKIGYLGQSPTIQLFATK